MLEWRFEVLVMGWFSGPMSHYIIFIFHIIIIHELPHITSYNHISSMPFPRFFYYKPNFTYSYS